MQLVTSLTANYSDTWISMLQQGVTAPELCSYLDWAYYSVVTLSGNTDKWEAIRSTECKTYFNSVTQAKITTEWSNDGFISNGFNK